MHVAAARPFRCHYRQVIPGQQPLALFIQLRARDRAAALQLAQHTAGFPIDRVEPAPLPITTRNHA